MWGVPEEQGADGYLKGQIWNRDEEEKTVEEKPYIFVWCSHNWAEVGDLINFTVSRRFKAPKRGKRKKGELSVRVVQNGVFDPNNLALFAAGVADVIKSYPALAFGGMTLEVASDPDEKYLLSDPYVYNGSSVGGYYDGCQVLNPSDYPVFPSPGFSPKLKPAWNGRPFYGF